MKNTVGIICYNEKADGLWYSPIYEMPLFAGYKLIDYTVSAMINSGINNIAVLANKRDLAKSGYIGGALFNTGIDAIKIIPCFKSFISDSMSFLKNCREKYVLFCSVDTVFGYDFSELIKFHDLNSSDITVVSDGNTGTSSGIYIMSRHLFIKLSDRSELYGNDDIKALAEKTINNLKISYYSNGKYLKSPQSAGEYLKMSFEMLCGKAVDKNKSIFTVSNEYPPTAVKRNAEIKNSIIGGGCTVYGTAYGSVLSSGVILREGARVSNSVIMDKCFIGKRCTIRDAVLKDRCIIKENVTVSGSSRRPAVIEKGEIITGDVILRA